MLNRSRETREKFESLGKRFDYEELKKKIGVSLASALILLGVNTGEAFGDQVEKLYEGEGESEHLDANRLFSQKKIEEIERGLQREGKGLSYRIDGSESDYEAKTSVKPGEDSVEGNVEVSKKGSWEGDISVLGQINSIENDVRLEASYKILYAGAKLGTYIGIKRGTEFEQYLLSQGFKVKGGMIKLSGSLLKKLVKVNFSEVNKEEEEKMTQKAVGLEYTKEFNEWKILKELKSKVVFYDVDGEKLGTVGNIIKDTANEYDWTRVKGGIRGGQSLLLELESTIRLSERLKLGLTGGYDRTRYESMYDEDSKTEHGMVYGAKMTYQPNKANRIEIEGKHYEGYDKYGAKYEHDFMNNLSMHIKGERIDNKDGIEDENRGEIGITYTFGGPEKDTGFTPLFPEAKDREELRLSDLDPINEVEAEEIKVKEKVVYKEHMAHIDKSALGADGSIEKNEDGTLEKVNIDTGINNLVNGEIDDINYGKYKDNFKVKDNSLLVIEDFEKLKTPATYKISLEQQDSNYAIVELKVEEGSVELNINPRFVGDISEGLAKDYVEGNKSFSEVQQEADSDSPVDKTVSESVDEDNTLSSSVSTTDPNGDSLTYSKKTGPSHGSLNVNSDGSYVYTPDANYNGSDSFEIEAADGDGNTGTITVEVSVNSVNDTPTLNLTGYSSEYYTITKESETDSKVVFESNNSSSTEYDRFDFSFSDNESLQKVTYKNGLGGTIKTETLSGTSDTSYVEVPGDSDGSTKTITVEVEDSDGEVTQYKTIEVNYQMNDAPESKTVSESVDEDNTLSSSVSTNDPDGDSLTYSKKSGPSNGILSVASDGSYTYQPNANFNGSDSFEIEAVDGNGGTGTITVEVTVNSINDAPTAQDVTADAGGQSSFGYDMNPHISDIEDSDSDLSITVVSGPSEGELGWGGTNGNEFGYSCTNSGYIGDDSFTYKVIDSDGGESEVKTVTITNINNS